MAAVRRPDLKKYKRVKEDVSEEKKETAPNHLMVSAAKPGVLYIKRAIQLFNGVEGDETAQKFRTVSFLGRGKAMRQVVQIVEVVKRRVVGLHQISKIENMQVTDLYTPKNPEAGLEDLKIDRTIGGLHITLSLDELDTSDMGYQAPLPESEVKPEEALKDRPKRNNRKKEEKTGGRGAGGARGRGSVAGRGAAPARGRGGNSAPQAGRGRGGAAQAAGRGAGGKGGRGGSARGRGQ